jgi:hypothetical protein
LTDDLQLLDFTDILDGYEKITCIKIESSEQGKRLYSYRDACRAAKEEQDWQRRAKTKETAILPSCGANSGYSEQWRWSVTLTCRRESSAGHMRIGGKLRA